MNASEIRWNDEARAKVLTDADNVLRDAVVELNGSMQGKPSDEIYAALNERLKDRFIDYEPGPDVRKYADAIARGDIEA
ncbi:hypothetical protein B7R21_01495 [Subtercola boreus]|uniref:Uncharacterized protein n=1 Tax=Subtercola boreus TaxID=120213 RepID=A0A3E0W5I0_9MICO|nr:hypothetical protein [Subtercola boreus]RFA16813.1 hypothetical protein B7R21_01495 [Subtercola boreus]